MTPEPIDPMLGRPLTPAERAALNELMRQITLSREDRERNPIIPTLDRVTERLTRLSADLAAREPATPPAAEPIPLSREERIALMTLARLRERGVIGPSMSTAEDAS